VDPRSVDLDRSRTRTERFDCGPSVSLSLVRSTTTWKRSQAGAYL
jgi:hypothetical protein